MLSGRYSYDDRRGRGGCGVSEKSLVLAQWVVTRAWTVGVDGSRVESLASRRWSPSTLYACTYTNHYASMNPMYRSWWRSRRSSF